MVVRCGVCHGLFSRDGAWTPSYENVLTLVRWAPVLDEALNMCVQGLISDMETQQGPVKVRVVLRLSARRVAGATSLLRLQGPPCHGPDTPQAVVALFQDGFPEDWHGAHVKWAKMVVAESSPGSEGQHSPALSSAPLTAPSIAPSNAPGFSAAAARGDGGENLCSDSAIGSGSVVPTTWLPPQKVLDITRWMDMSEGVVGRQLGDSVPAADAAPANRQVFAAPKAIAPRLARPPVPTFFQSTPITGERPPKFQLNLSMSSVSTMTVSTTLGLLEPKKGGRKRPRESPPPPDSSTVLNATKVPALSETVQSTIQLTPKRRVGNKKPIETPIRRNLQKVVRKIERWRPVLGVDGRLKLQGYLVLNDESAAMQILTSNTVEQWLGRRAVTVDGCEFQLVGEPLDPTGRLPRGLRSVLGGRVPCEDIESALREEQLLKEDVTASLHLAPPPAPETIRTTRSGRVCRPRAPYWLNRSDWGAEYEIFYGDSSLSSTPRHPKEPSAARHRGVVKPVTPPRSRSLHDKERMFPNHMEEAERKLQNAKKSVRDRLSCELDASLTTDEEAPATKGKLLQGSGSTQRRLEINLNKHTSADKKAKQAALSMRKLSTSITEEMEVHKLSAKDKNSCDNHKSSDFACSFSSGNSCVPHKLNRVDLLKKKLITHSPRVVLSPLKVSFSAALKRYREVTGKCKESDSVKISTRKGSRKINSRKQIILSESEKEDSSFDEVKRMTPDICKEKAMQKDKGKFSSKVSEECNIKRVGRLEKNSATVVKKRMPELAQKQMKSIDMTISESEDDESMQSTSVDVKCLKNANEKSKGSDSVKISTSKGSGKTNSGRPISFPESETEGSSFDEVKQVTHNIFKEKAVQEDKEKLNSKVSEECNMKSVGRLEKQSATVVKRRMPDLTQKQMKLMDVTISNSEDDKSMQSTSVDMKRLKNASKKSKGSDNLKVSESRVYSQSKAKKRILLAGNETDNDSVMSLEHSDFLMPGQFTKTRKETKPESAKGTTGKSTSQLLVQVEASGSKARGGKSRKVVAEDRKFETHVNSRHLESEQRKKMLKANKSRAKKPEGKKPKAKEPKAKEPKAKKETEVCPLEMGIGAPKTLRERKARDAAVSAIKCQMEQQLSGTDDPLEGIMQQAAYANIPAEWCDFNNFLKVRGKGRHRLSPCSSPSSHSIMSEASSMVSCALTPQLISSQPKKEHIQRYLQRRGPLRMGNALKHQKPSVPSQPISIEEMQYGRIFLEDERLERSEDEEWD